MGSPKKQRKKFSKPSHPWQKERILAEKEILKSYGLRRKFEIWKMNSILKNFTSQAKNLITTATQQTDRERNQLLTKLSSLGLIESNAKIDDVLSLTLKDIMERRLQTLVFKKNMARNLKQARQFIVHEHISVANKKITSPSYLVPLSEEVNMQFASGSALANVSHPERLVDDKKPQVKKSKDKTDKTQKPEIDKKESKKETKTGKNAKEDQKISEPKKSEEKQELKEEKTEPAKAKKH